MTSLNNDDFLVFKGSSGTTLMLAADTACLLDTNFNVDTPKLAVYADSIALGPELKSIGKTVQLHCNNLLTTGPISIDVAGEPGVVSAAVADPTNPAGPQVTANGKAGGSIVLHVHNLSLQPGTETFSFWTGNPTFKVAGGQAGSYANADGSTAAGTAGNAGSVRILYSNSLLRAISAIQVAHASNASLSRRLALLRTRCLPVLDETIKKTSHPWAARNLSWLKSITDGWQSASNELRGYVDASFNLHVTFVRCAELLDDGKFPKGVTNMVQHIQAFLKTLETMRDYSDFPAEVNSNFEKLNNAMITWSGLGASASTKEVQVGLKYLKAELKTIDDLATSMANKVSQDKTTLSGHIEKVLGDFTQLLQKCETDLSGADPQANITFAKVSTGLDDTVDLSLDVPLVHPEQCLMSRRHADAAFFAGDYDKASSIYTTLLERLSFVSRLKSSKNSGEEAAFEHWPLYTAMDKMELEEGLSVWTFDTLESMSKEVQILLGQLSLGMDLFNLAPDWAPRLSFRYYLDYALQQLSRLKTFENSYHELRDQDLSQRQVAATLRDALVLNVYQNRDIENRLHSDTAAFQRLENELKEMKPSYEAAETELKKALEKSEKALEEYRYISAARIVKAVASLTTGIGLCFLGPLGIAGGVFLMGSTIAQSISMAEDAKSKIEDSYGVVVNKEYILRSLDTCGNDLESLLKSEAYTRNADGTKVVDGDGAAKLLATETQIKNFLGQFKDKFDDNKALSRSLDKFMDLVRQQNEKIIAYNNAVMSCYQQILQRAVVQKQMAEVSSQLIKVNCALPSIVGCYKRLRDNMRFAILRTIKQSVLALNFWGLGDGPKFSDSAPPGMLSGVDELEAHIAVLLDEYESCLTTFGRVAQIRWRYGTSNSGGIVYKLSKNELASLKLATNDPFGDGIRQRKVEWDMLTRDPTEKPGSTDSTPRIFSTIVNGLKHPVTRGTSLRESPFAGHANVRISQVNFWAPGLRFAGKANDSEPLQRLVVEIQHGGNESIVDIKDRVSSFQHWPVRLLSETNYVENSAVGQQAIASDWDGFNLNAKCQAPIGPFATWMISIREKDQGGSLDWSNVIEAFIRFEGYGMPFEG